MNTTWLASFWLHFPLWISLIGCLDLSYTLIPSLKFKSDFRATATREVAWLSILFYRKIKPKWLSCQRVGNILTVISHPLNNCLHIHRNITATFLYFSPGRQLYRLLETHGGDRIVPNVSHLPKLFMHLHEMILQSHFPTTTWPHTTTPLLNFLPSSRKSANVYRPSYRTSRLASSIQWTSLQPAPSF